MVSGPLSSPVISIRSPRLGLLPPRNSFTHAGTQGELMVSWPVEFSEAARSQGTSVQGLLQQLPARCLRPVLRASPRPSASPLTATLATSCANSWSRPPEALQLGLCQGATLPHPSLRLVKGHCHTRRLGVTSSSGAPSNATLAPRGPHPAVSRAASAQGQELRDCDSLSHRVPVLVLA